MMVTIIKNTILILLGITCILLSKKIYEGLI